MKNAFPVDEIKCKKEDMQCVRLGRGDSRETEERKERPFENSWNTYMLLLWLL